MPLPVAAHARVVQVASATGGVLVVGALVVLSGWAFQVPALTSIVPGVAAMKPNTAAAFLLTGLALLRPHGRELRFYWLGVMLIGWLTVIEYLAHADFGVDQLLFRDPKSPIFPGRMSQITAVGFTLLGTALALMKVRSEKGRRVSRAFASAVAGLGIIALLGYSYGTNARQMRPHSRMALDTALAFVIAAIGVHCANPEEGLVRRIHADTAGGAMLRRLLPAALLIPYLLGFAVWIAQKNFDWGLGFSLALFVAGVMLCLVFLILLHGKRLEREDVTRRESEARFSLVANTAPVMIWMSGPDKLCTYFNKPWLEFTGRTLDQELGNGWAEGVHPDDLKSCMDTYVEAFDQRQSFRLQYRLRRQDGEYRWILDIGVPRFNHDCSFAGYIGSCIDITDRKLAEEALADVGRRLIEAQDEERSRIARELHDDISQRVAVLMIQLQRWDQCVAEADVELHNHIRQALQQISDIGSDIRDLSHRLHSSYVEYLGPVASTAGLCQELSDQQNVEIDFTHRGIPDRVPKEVSLCLFRILQEALQNAIKHSGVRHFTVELSGTPAEIRLRVHDLGAGFDQQNVLQRHGLGLISMRERLQLVNGEFSITSRPGGGTTIDARVPLKKQIFEEQPARWPRTA